MVSRDPRDQSSPNLGNMCPLVKPLTTPNFIMLHQTVYKKSTTIFFTPSLFWCPGGTVPLRSRKKTLRKLVALRQKYLRYLPWKVFDPRKVGQSSSNLGRKCLLSRPITMLNFGEKQGPPCSPIWVVMYSKSPLSSCQISSHSKNRSMRICCQSSLISFIC